MRYYSMNYNISIVSVKKEGCPYYDAPLLYYRILGCDEFFTRLSVGDSTLNSNGNCSFYFTPCIGYFDRNHNGKVLSIT